MKKKVGGKILFGSLFLFFIGSFSTLPLSAETLKIGYVNTMEVFEKYSKTQERDKLFGDEKRKKESAVQKETEKRQKEIIALSEKLEKEKSLLKEEEIKKRKEEIGKKQESLISYINKVRQELSNRNRELVNMCREEVISAIKKFGQKNGYDYIFEKGAVLYGPKVEDITQELIDLLNKK